MGIRPLTKHWLNNKQSLYSDPEATSKKPGLKLNHIHPWHSGRLVYPQVPAHSGVIREEKSKL